MNPKKILNSLAAFSGLALLLAFPGCSNPSSSSSDTPTALKLSDVTIAGSYYSTQTSPCYWMNGENVALPLPAGAIAARAASIAVSGNDVYVGGNYVTALRQSIGGYWKNGTFNALVGLDASVRSAKVSRNISGLGSIKIIGGKLYVAGAELDEARYWIDGAAHACDVPVPAESKMNDIAVVDGKTYGAGVYDSLPCYWTDGAYTALDVPSGSTGEAIAVAVLNGSVYISGWVTDAASATTPCYWQDGDYHALDLPSGNSVEGDTLAIRVVGSSVYIAGEGWYADASDNNTYAPIVWKDGVPQVLDVAAAQTRGGYVNAIGEKYGLVYFAGTSCDADYEDTPCVWIDGTYTALPLPTDATSGDANGTASMKPKARARTSR